MVLAIDIVALFVFKMLWEREEANLILNRSLKGSQVVMYGKHLKHGSDKAVDIDIGAEAMQDEGECHPSALQGKESLLRMWCWGEAGEKERENIMADGTCLRICESLTVCQEILMFSKCSDPEKHLQEVQASWAGNKTFLYLWTWKV